MTDLFGEQFWWFLARSGGVVALVLSMLSVLWGLLLSGKYLQGGPKPKGLLDLHKFLGALTVVFTALHMIGLYLDTFVEFGVRELLLPFASSWRPAEVAAGVVAFWLLVAVQVTSMVMHKIPRRWWKLIHLASFAMLPLGILHGITAGTDASTGWFQFGTAGFVGLLAYLTAWRSIAVPKRARRAVTAQA